MVGVITVDNTYLTDVFNQYKLRENLLYQTWFVKSEKRLKAFKKVRKYVQVLINMSITERSQQILKIQP